MSPNHNQQNTRTIAIIVECWRQGGTETYVRGLVRFLLSQGYKIEIIILEDNNSIALDFINEFNIHKLDKKELYSCLIELEVDVVNLHLYKSLLHATIICKYLRLPVINTLHMPLDSWGLKIKSTWIIGIYLSNTVIGVSRLVKSQIVSKNLWQKPLPGGVASVFFENSVPLRSKLESTDISAFRIAAIGRFSKEKSWNTLLYAVANVVEKESLNIVVDFYGDGALKDDIISLAEDLRVNIIIHGFYSQQELSLRLVDNHLSVLPSKFEGLGLSAIESMAAGLPTVTANFEAASDFILEGVTGNMFAMGDYHALSNIILWHIKNPSQSIKIAQNGSDSVEKNFSEDNVFMDYLDILG